MKPLRLSSWPWAVLGLVLLILLVAWAWYGLQLRPVNSADHSSHVFVVSQGEKTRQIADDLQSAHLIRSKAAFMIFVDLHGLRPHLQAGIYQLEPSYSTPDVVDLMAGGKVVSDRLTIPEGYTLAQIRQLVTAKGINGSSFDAAVNASYNFDFLSSRPAGVGLEGYLFPDSYQINSATTAQNLVRVMLQNFGLKVTPDLVAAFKSQGLTLHQGLTLASIVEKEVPDSHDRAIVAGIFLRRLASGQPLQSDVTVIYAANKLGQPFSTSLNSPYNTYLNPGLPPGPIDSPGLDAISAAAHPITTDYVYFVAGKDGQTHYATTYAQQQQNIQRYTQ